MSQCHFVNHKFIKDWLENEPGSPWREASNELSEPWYGPGCCTRSESNVFHILIGITKSGFFFASCLIQLLQGQILMGLFSAVIQWHLPIAEPLWTSFLVFCCFYCHHCCCSCCCCRQVPFHTGWSSANWSVTVSSQTLLDSSQVPLNTIWCLFLKFPKHP